MPKPRIMALHIPGPDTEPDNEIQDTDSVILIPYSLVKSAMDMSEELKKKIYIYKSQSNWIVEQEDGDIPIDVDLEDRKKVVCVFKNDILSHDYYATI